MGKMLALLKDGDRRSIGRAAEAARLARVNAALVTELVDLLSYPGAAVRMRAADALEKASAQNEAVLASHKTMLMDIADSTTQTELRWRLAQLLPRLDLDDEDITDAADLFVRWYRRDHSPVVRTFVLQGMAELASRDTYLIGETEHMLQDALSSATPSLKVRARKVKLQLERLRAATES